LTHPQRWCRIIVWKNQQDTSGIERKIKFKVSLPTGGKDCIQLSTSQKTWTNRIRNFSKVLNFGKVIILCVLCGKNEISLWIESLKPARRIGRSKEPIGFFLNTFLTTKLRCNRRVGRHSPAFAGRQERASVRPCAVGALLCLDLLILLGQAKRTKKKKISKQQVKWDFSNS
jgi:hypothetical protein